MNIFNDRLDVDKLEYLPLAKGLGVDLKYGISIKENVCFWTYSATSKNPHFLQEYRETFFAIDYLAKNFTTKGQGLKNLYLLFSEMWRDHWIAYEKVSALNEKVNELTKEINSK